MNVSDMKLFFSVSFSQDLFPNKCIFSGKIRIIGNAPEAKTSKLNYSHKREDQAGRGSTCLSSLKDST